MKNNNGKMQVSLLALAVQGAILAMCAIPAHAEDDEVAALTNPVNTVEVGVTNVSHSSAKFGEYTGMNKSGVNADLGLSIKGGDSYGQNTGIRRWSINGSDLGLTSRSAGATVSDQGKWNIGISYDEIQHNVSDTYKTPYIGTMGGNNFTLPVGFLPIANTNTTGLAAVNAALHPVDVATHRKNSSVNAGFIMNDQWSVKFDYNHLDQTGAKLESFGSMANTLLAVGVTGEAISVLPSPTNYKTDTLNLALNWKGDQAHVSTSYFGSFFRDGYNGINFQTFAGTASGIQTMSTAPSNDFHQLNINGGYDFSSKTKLTGGLSYGRNTQNEAYVVDAVSMVTAAPQTSLNGLVNTYHADLKLTDQTTKDLKLSGSIKYDERDDKTASNFYNFNALDGAANHVATFANTPYSNKKTQLELAGDYRINSNQHLRLAYNREEVKRWCNQYAVSVGIANGVSGYYPAGTNCVVATASNDDKLSANYRLRASEDLSLNAGYSYSKRVTTSDPNAITARIGTNGNIVNATGTGFVAPLTLGINAGDFRGFFPFFDASRKQQMLKAGANWQANEKWSLGAGMKYTDDKYDSLYGVQNGNSWSVNLDTNYAYSENGSFAVYMTQQHRERTLTDLQAITAVNSTATRINVPSGSTWTDKQKDDDTTIGIAAKHKGLMDSKLELNGDMTYTIGRTNYGTLLNYAGTTSGLLTCSAPNILSCGQLPEIQNRVAQIKLTAKYSVDKKSKVAFGYIYQQMKSIDFYYNGLQAGLTPNTMMPSNLQAANYTVNTVTLAYMHEF